MAEGSVIDNCMLIFVLNFERWKFFTGRAMSTMNGMTGSGRLKCSVKLQFFDWFDEYSRLNLFNRKTPCGMFPVRCNIYIIYIYISSHETGRRSVATHHLVYTWKFIDEIHAYRTGTPHTHTQTYSQSISIQIYHYLIEKYSVPEIFVAKIRCRYWYIVADRLM